MSYLVLARKYRPKTFSEMVGQGHVVRALVNALDQQRLHHAYLFTGTRGVGKTTVSRILAKSLNCQGLDGLGGITSTPCGQCMACVDIDSGRFVDYTELDAASNRGVDEIQSLLEQAVYKPVQGRFKVFMIDEVHMLTNTAFNAMLKTLEEPPAYLKFVLATTDPQKVPVTVLSRCLQFNLKPMPPEVLVSHLEQVLVAESVAFESAALKLIARFAHGSMRDALSLTDQAMAFGAGKVLDDLVQQMLGTPNRTQVLDLIKALALADGASILDGMEQLRMQGLSAAAVLEDMALVLQSMAILQAVPEKIQLLEQSNDADAHSIQLLANTMPADETQLLYSMCLQGRTELSLAPDEYVGLTMVLLRLLAFQPPSESAEKKSPVLKPTANRPVSVDDQPAVNGLSKPLAAAISAKLPNAHSPVQAERDTASGRHLPVRDQFAQKPAVSSGVVPSSNAIKFQEQPLQPLKVMEVMGLEGRLELPSNTKPVEIVTSLDGDFWQDLVQRMIDADLIAAFVRELALQSQLIARDQNHWLLRTEHEALNNANARDRLAQALVQMGHSVNIQLEVGRVDDSPAKRNAVRLEQRQWEAESVILKDPFVQKMMQLYAAKIVPGSLKPL